MKFFGLILFLIGVKQGEVAAEDEVVLQDKTATVTEVLLLLEWSGTQETFGDFRMLSPISKGSLREFTLSNTENLNIDLLLDELRPCSNLETIELSNVELIGQFPNDTSKLNLPQLRHFVLDLSYVPYPVQSLSCADYAFFKKGDLFQNGVTFKITVKGQNLCKVDYNFGELVMKGGNDVAATVSTFLKGHAQGQGSLTEFSLKQLALATTQVETALIPSDLTYLQLMFTRPDTGYNDLLLKNKRLRKLHLADELIAHVDLEWVPMTLEVLSLQNFHVALNTSFSTEFPNSVNIFFRNCTFESGVIDRVDDLFPTIEKFGIVFSQENASICFPLLNKIVFSKKYSDLELLDYIFIENCQWPEDKELSSKFSTLKKFLDDRNLLKGSPNFVFEKKNDWITRPISIMEGRRNHYDSQSWGKFFSFTTYKILMY